MMSDCWWIVMKSTPAKSHHQKAQIPFRPKSHLTSLPFTTTPPPVPFYVVVSAPHKSLRPQQTSTHSHSIPSLIPSPRSS
ncbi:hypothetical protein AKJ16_DCAP08462 [Drosera capensis]